MLDDLFTRPMQAVWLAAGLTVAVVLLVHGRRAARRAEPTVLQRSARDLARAHRQRSEPWWIG